MKDLYQTVNGPWLDSHVIPSDRGVDGTFHALRDKAEEDVHALLENGTDRGSDLYASFMDTDEINIAGMSPIEEDLTLIDVSSPTELAAAFGALDRTGVGAPLTFWVEKDSLGDTAVPYLIQSGLGLPDEAYYREPAHAETLAAYRAHVERMLGFLDADRLFGASPADAASRIVDLEAQIASHHWDVVASRDSLKTYNPTTLGELPDIIQTLLTASGLPEGRVIVMMPSFAEKLAELLISVPLTDWKLWATWAILRSRAGVLTEDVGAANFEFYGTVLSGATEQRDRWKRGVALAESLVGEDLGKAYVDKHFPADSKAQMLELVDYLVDAYEQRISTLPWMSPETRERAMEKLRLFNAKIGYPDTWRSYEGLEFSREGGDLVANVRAGAAFEHDYQVSKVGKPADRNEWVATPQTVNAFYNPVVNDITFRPRSCSRHSSTRQRMRRRTSVPSALLSAMRSDMASTIRARVTTATGTSTPGGPTRTAPGLRSSPPSWSSSMTA